MNIKHLYLLVIIIPLSSFKILHKDTSKVKSPLSLNNYNLGISIDTLILSKKNNLLKGQKWYYGGGPKNSSSGNSYYFLNNNKYNEESWYSGGQYIVRKYSGTYHYSPSEKIVYLRKKDITVNHKRVLERIKKDSIVYNKWVKKGFIKDSIKHSKWIKEQLILTITSKDKAWRVEKGWIKSGRQSNINIQYPIDPKLLLELGRSYYKIERE